jgi:hypothetical protein
MLSAVNKISLCVTLLAAASLLAGCSKHEDKNDKPAKTAAPPPPPPPPPPAPPAPPRADVPFKGTYSKYAETTFKNGRRVSVSNKDAVATLTVAAGRATYAQTYTARGKKNTVVQVYTFGPENVKPTAGGGYDVALTFQSMSGDTQNYSPDKNNPKMEARKQASGWEIGLITTDNNGVMGGVEFK